MKHLNSPPKLILRNNLFSRNKNRNEGDNTMPKISYPTEFGSKKYSINDAQLKSPNSRKVKHSKGKSKNLQLFEEEKAKSKFYNEFLSFKSIDIKDQMRKIDVKSELR